MKPYSRRKYHGWSHSNKTIRKMRSLGEWDDLGPADYSRSGVRREAREEIEEIEEQLEEFICFEI